MIQGIQTPQQKIHGSKMPRPEWHEPGHLDWDAFCKAEFPRPLTKESWEAFKKSRLNQRKEAV